MPLLGLLWGASGLTSVGRYLMIGVAGLFAAGILVNGITAPYKREIASLKNHVRDVEQAADKRAKILEEDSKLAEAQEEEVLRLRSQIKGILDATPAPSPACKLSSVQLQQLRSVIGTN